MMYNRIKVALGRSICVALILLLLCMSHCLASNGSSPRIANLWGAQSTSKDYDLWSKYDMLIMGGGDPNAWRDFYLQLKSRNPSIQIFGTGPFTSVAPPVQAPWMLDEWYLRWANGEKVNWWVGQTYVPNLFHDGYLSSAVDIVDAGYGYLVREGRCDGVMFDSVVGGVTWLGPVDTDLDGIADTPGDVDRRWQQRQNLFFDMLHERFPNTSVIANDVDLRHASHLHGRLFEGARLLDNLMTGYLSPQEIVYTLKSWTSQSMQPTTTFAIMTHPIGWQWWRLGDDANAMSRTTPGELERIRRDHSRMRLGLLTTMMSDAYFGYDYGTVYYGLPLWYAEYDAPLGQPVSESQEVFDVPPTEVFSWQAGQSTDGLILYPGISVTEAGIESGIDDPVGVWHGLLMTNSATVRLEPGRTYRVEADCDILREVSLFQCTVRTDTGGYMIHDKGVRHSTTGDAKWAGTKYHVITTVVPDSFDDYVVRFDQLGSGSLRIKSLKISLMHDSYFKREFQGGTAFLNCMPHAITVNLGKTMKRLRDSSAPRYAVDMDDIMGYPRGKYPEQVLRRYLDPGKLRVPWEFSAGNAWEERSDSGHQYGET